MGIIRKCWYEMYVLNVNRKNWVLGDAWDRLVEVAGKGKNGFLNLEKENGKKEKVVVSLSLWDKFGDGEEGEGEVEELRRVGWDVVRGTREQLEKALKRGLTATRLVQEDTYSEGWSPAGVLDGVHHVEVRVPDGFSDLREMQRVCDLDPRVRVVGGTILTLPTLNIRAGRKDKKGIDIFTDGVYDDLRDLQFPERVGGLVRVSSEAPETVGRKRHRSVGKKRRVGVRASGVRSF